MPFTRRSDAAAQIYQTSHSCIAQYFPRSSVGGADEVNLVGIPKINLTNGFTSLTKIE
jgi:hypothetical protein